MFIEFPVKNCTCDQVFMYFGRKNRPDRFWARFTRTIKKCPKIGKYCHQNDQHHQISRITKFHNFLTSGAKTRTIRSSWNCLLFVIG